ncbi:MAG: hypothetical protein ACR2ON_08410 [Paracoccaceae bacterium]
MAQNQTLPLGSGLGAIRAPSLQGDANEAAFRKDAASGGILGELLGMYPTQTEAINARKSAQAGILEAIKNLTSGTGSMDSGLLNAIDSPDSLSVNRSLGALGDFDAIAKSIQNTLEPKVAGGDQASSLDIFNPDLSAGGIGSERMPLTGGGDQPGDATFGGTIPESRDPNLDVDIGAAGLGVEPPAGAEGSTPPTTTIGGAGSGEEAGGLGEANAGQGLVFSGTSQGAGDPTKTPKSAFEAGLVEAMKDYEDAKAGKDTGTKDIDYYKQKFSEATGIDTSGQVDKSQALMAFGLALMQNKAGKGFDVGNMLNAVGAAGEKAQPLLAKAQSEARAAQLAGGKYALNQVAKDEADRKSSITAALQRVQVLQDKAIDAQDKVNLALLKGRLEAQKERIKAEGAVRKAAAEKGDPDLYLEKTESLPLFDEAPDAFKITAFLQAPNVDKDIPVKLTNGSVAGLRAQFNASERALNKAEDELTKLTGIVSKDGITTQQQIASYINSFGRGFGINVDQSLDPVAEAKIILERIATQQAPEILGESGKTISDADRERVTRIVGDIGLLAKADPQVIMQKLKSVYGLIVESGRNNLDTAYNKLHAMGYDYGPFAQQQQQPDQPSSGGFTPSDQQQKILGKYGI